MFQAEGIITPSHVLQGSMPESPAAVRSRYLDMDLPIADVLILTDEKPFSRYFDAVLEAGAPPKLAANWVLGDVMAHSKVCDDKM